MEPRAIVKQKEGGGVKRLKGKRIREFHLRLNSSGTCHKRPWGRLLMAVWLKCCPFPQDTPFHSIPVLSPSSLLLIDQPVFQSRQVSSLVIELRLTASSFAKALGHLCKR